MQQIISLCLQDVDMPISLGSSAKIVAESVCVEAVCLESVITCLCLFTLKGGSNGRHNLLTRKGFASLSASVIHLGTAHLCTVSAAGTAYEFQ